MTRSGLLRNGKILPTPALVDHTRAAGFGWPTPCAADAEAGQIIGVDDRFVITRSGSLRHHYRTGNNRSLTLGRAVRFFPEGPLPPQGGKALTKEAALDHGNLLNPSWVEWLMGYPTRWTAV